MSLSYKGQGRDPMANSDNKVKKANKRLIVDVVKY